MSILDFFRRPQQQSPSLPIEPIQPIPVPVVNPFLSRFKVYEPNRKILNCIWNTQRDNRHTPGSACNVTSMQSAISMDLQITDDEMWELCYSPQVWDRLSKKFDKKSMAWLAGMRTKRALNEVHSVLLCMLEELLGVGYAKIIGNLDPTILRKEIDLGYAVVIAGQFTHAGHFVCVVGYDDSRQAYIVNDSWGDWMSGYRNQNGDNVAYVYNRFSFGKFISRTAFLIHADRRIPV